MRIGEKRNMSVILLLVFVMLLAACSKGNGGSAEGTMNNGKSGSNAGGETLVEKEKPKPVSLKVLLTGPGKQQDSDKVWTEFNNRLQEYLPNTTVEFSIIEPSQYKQ